MAYFSGDLTLEDQIEIFQVPVHPIVLNFRAWCRCIINSHSFPPELPILELSKPLDLEDYPYPHAQLVESCLIQGWLEAKACYDYMVNLREMQYHLVGILILYNRVLECVSKMCDNYTNNFDTSHIMYPEIDPKNEEGLELAISIF